MIKPFFQLTINRLTRDIEADKDNSGKYWERENQLRSKQVTLEARLEEKTKDVDRLEKLLSSVKQECTATVTEKVIYQLLCRVKSISHADAF